MTDVVIKKMADYVLLNAYSVDAFGLYNGKAGISLALFEASRLLENDFLEEHAFELFQESLLYKGEDISFANGYCGISFVLHYLIDNNFVEADINELFGEQEKKIQSATYEEIAPFSDISVSTLSACIDRLYLLHSNEEQNREEIKLLELYVFSSIEKEQEKKLLKIMASGGVEIGYACGLVRWLLYAIYVEYLNRRLDISRFDNLFKLMPLWKR